MSVVIFLTFFRQEYVDKEGVLRVAFVLNWMDSLTCLTAEKMTLRSMVTAQLSDLHFKGQAYLGIFFISWLNHSLYS